MNAPANDDGAARAHLLDLVRAHGWTEGVALRPGMDGFGAAVAAADVADRLWGRQHARALWVRLGLPAPHPGPSASATGTTPEVATGEAVAHVLAFVEQQCERLPAGSIAAGDLWRAYVDWCDRRDEVNLTPTMLGRSMAALGFRKRKSGKMRYLGFRLRTPISNL